MMTEKTSKTPKRKVKSQDEFELVPIRDAYSSLPEPLAKVLTKAHDTVDPVSFFVSLGSAVKGAGSNRPEMSARVSQLSKDLSKAWLSSAKRMVGNEEADVKSPEKGDRRFSNRAWQENAVYNYIMQYYLLMQEFSKDLVDMAELDDKTTGKARLAMNVVTDALSPTNFFPTSPEAVTRAFETGGASVVKAFSNQMRDMVKNNGWPEMVDKSEFELGENMATTPGKVVFRNDLIELIQYEPQTETVHEIPLLYNPAWINRYYILDLAPGKSLVEWAVQHGHTMFAISYRNPDESMRDVTFADYMKQGPIAAIEAIQAITGQEKVNMLSVCLGGTLTAATIAYLNATGKDWVNSFTQLNSHVDFSIPGDLGVFADIDTIMALERRMEKDGYADGDTFSRTFNLLRGRELIWNYVSSGWLLGDKPPAFDLLAWNSDNTRLPAKMHSFYLRKCYVDNALAQDQMVLEGEQLKVSEIKQDCYVVGAEGDHIVPWQSSYKATQVFDGKVRYVLSSGGHIAGMVNPPHPKATFSVNEKSYPEDPQAWLESAKRHKKSWWEDWITWANKHAGKKIQRPEQMGCDQYPPISDAPGEYVKG